MMSMMEVGHVTIISLLLGIIHGLKFRVEWERNGDGKARLKYRIYFANKNE